MDRKKIDSYEETHRKLVEAMQEACVRDDFDDYPDPDIDISFIYEDIDDDAEAENMPPETRKKRFSFTSRFNKVAAILVVLLLTGNILLLATNSNESYGDRGLLHRLSETVTGVVTDNDNPVSEDEVVETYTVTSEDGIDKMAKKFPDLYVPKYIPEGFDLKSFEFRTYGSGDSLALYCYSNGTNTLNINISYCSDANTKIYTSHKNYEIIYLDDITVQIYQDIIDGKIVLDAFFENCIVEIDGIDSKIEMMKIIKSMKKHTS